MFVFVVFGCLIVTIGLLESHRYFRAMITGWEGSVTMDDHPLKDELEKRRTRKQIKGLLYCHKCGGGGGGVVHGG